MNKHHHGNVKPSRFFHLCFPKHIQSPILLSIQLWNNTLKMNISFNLMFDVMEKQFIDEDEFVDRIQLIKELLYSLKMFSIVLNNIEFDKHLFQIQQINL